MLRNYDDPSQDPVFSYITILDLADVVPSISGPKRPHDRVSVSQAQKDFQTCLTNKVSELYYIIIKYTNIDFLYSYEYKIYNLDQNLFQFIDAI